MMKKWFGASLLVLVLALAGCSEEKAKPEEKPKSEQKEKSNSTQDLAQQQAKIIKNMKEKAVTLDPKALEADPKAYDKQIIKVQGTVSSEEVEKVGSSFELKVDDKTFKVMNFTMGSSYKMGSDITVYGNVKTGKDAESGLPTLNATYIE